MTGMEDTVTPADPAPAPEPHPATDLWVERQGSRRYVGHSSSGARVEIGRGGTEGVFTPGELLKVALAACTAMASDFTVSRRLGEGYAAMIRVSGEADREQERYPRLEEIYELDLSGLEPAAAERLLTLVRRSVDSACTVGRTLEKGSEIDLEFDVR